MPATACPDTRAISGANHAHQSCRPGSASGISAAQPSQQRPPRGLPFGYWPMRLCHGLFASAGHGHPDPRHRFASRPHQPGRQSMLLPYVVCGHQRSFRKLLEIAHVGSPDRCEAYGVGKEKRWIGLRSGADPDVRLGNPHESAARLRTVAELVGDYLRRTGMTPPATPVVFTQAVHRQPRAGGGYGDILLDLMRSGRRPRCGRCMSISTPPRSPPAIRRRRSRSCVRPASTS